MKWFKNENISKADLILFPICEKKHWTLIIVDLIDAKIKFFNSLKTYNANSIEKYVKIIKLLLNDEFMSLKKGENMDNWHLINSPTELQQQEPNSNDCGVFIINYASTYCSNLEIKNEDMLKQWLNRDFIKNEIINFAMFSKTYDK